MAGKYRNGVVVALVLAAVGLISVIFFRDGSSETIISDRMSEFIDAVDRISTNNTRKLIVFDLDDTVLMSEEILGTPTWFYHMVNLLRQRGAAKLEAYNVMREIDRIVQEQGSVVAVEQATLSAIRNWSFQGSHLVAITSRPPSFAEITHEQLAKIGLEFSSPFYSCIESKWPVGQGAFSRGVIYVDFQHDRSEVFAQFFELAQRCGMNIDLLAHADDQVRHVSEIAKFAQEMRRAFVGIIYGKALSAREFKLAEANKQLYDLEQKLGLQIIPDQYRKIFAEGI
jgi:hypothetical protein